MSFGAVAGITLAIALVLVMGVGLMSYVSSLVKNAYQIKVELRADVESAIARMEGEMDRRGKALRKELGDDAGRLRENVQQDNERRIKAIDEQLQKTLRDLTDAGRADKAAMQSTLVDLQRRMKSLETDVAAIKEDLSRRAALGRAMRDKDRTDRHDDDHDEVPTPTAALSAAPQTTAPPPAAQARPAPLPATSGDGQRLEYGEL
ncbi:MAG: hypothetical protein WCZ23_00105 [Rhodospirillaceae bacterium]